MLNPAISLCFMTRLHYAGILMIDNSYGKLKEIDQMYLSNSALVFSLDVTKQLKFGFKIFTLISRSTRGKT